MEEQDTASRAAAVAEGLLSALEKAVKELSAVVVTRREKTKTEDGETVTEYREILPQIQGTVDLGALRQLTGVLKDMREIYGLQSAGEDSGSITVTWEGDTHVCAD